MPKDNEILSTDLVIKLLPFLMFLVAGCFVYFGYRYDLSNAYIAAGATSLLGIFLLVMIHKQTFTSILTSEPLLQSTHNAVVGFNVMSSTYSKDIAVAESKIDGLYKKLSVLESKLPDEADDTPEITAVKNQLKAEHVKIAKFEAAELKERKSAGELD